MNAASLLPDDAPRLHRLRSLGLLDTPAEAVLDGFTRLAAVVTGMPIALISLVDEDRQWFKSAVGLPQGAQTGRDVSFCGHAIAQDGLFEVTDATRDPRFHDNPLTTGSPHVVHYAGVPLEMPGGERIGTICVIDQQPGSLSLPHREFLAELARNIVHVLLLREDDQRLRDELKDRNQLLEAVIDHLPCGLAVYDEDLRHVVSNQRMLQQHDLPHDLLSAPDAGLHSVIEYKSRHGEFGPGDPQALARERLALSRTRQPMVFERARANGMQLEIRTAPMPNGWQVHVSNDVTEQKALARQLGQSEERLELALQATGLGLFEYAPLDDMLYLSQSWYERFGYPGESDYIRIGQLADLSTPETVGRFRQALVDLLKGVTPTMCVEHEMVNAAGQSIWAQTEAQVTERNEAGLAVRVVGTSKDITERKRQEVQLREAVERADAASQAKADFLATMSHEIRTPINGVIGLARMLEDAQLPARESSWVRMINSCASTLLGLVNDVLDFSKIEAGQMTLDPVETDLHTLLSETGDVFASRAQDKGVGFSVRIDPAVPQWVMADGHRLRQVLLNLLGNALKFTSRGAFSLHATVEPLAQPRTLRIDITDSGIGIAPEALQRLFKRYAQAEASTSREYQGTGLGLSICRDLARLMGGDVSVASTPGVGSTFTVAVPLVPVASRQAPVAAAAPQAGARPARILLVEDNAINQLVARSLLTKLGYRHITVAEDGRQAVAQCTRQAFDLVLMDCQMPVMDGFEATRALRDAGHRMPIIALTAGAVAQDRERCLATGMNDFLCKPIDGVLLAQALQQWWPAQSAPGETSGAPSPTPLLTAPH